MSKKVICFPCAGGNASNFNQIIQKNKKDFICIEYSGHWTRYKERLYESIEDCCESLYSEIAEMITPFDEICLLGHSMGGIVAYEMAGILGSKGYKVVDLILLGCMSPDEMDYRKVTFENDQEIKDFLKRIRQVSEKVLDSGFFSENLLPAIRRDFENLSDYLRYFCRKTMINANIVCLSGNKDILTSSMKGWQDYTRTSFEYDELEGDHFCFYKSENACFISELISRKFGM